MKEARLDELFASCSLVAVLDGEGGPPAANSEKRLGHCTKALVPEFVALCRVINDIKRNKTIVLPDSQGAVVCPRCGLPLPERGANCPACVPRLAVFRRLMGLLKPYRLKTAVLVATTFVSVAA